MSKNVFKEIIIAMLLCLAIILVLALVLYSYVPANKTLPEKIAYTTPERVADELVTSSDADTDEVILTYEVDNSDMSNYENVNSYNPGKSNPFTPFQELKDGTIVTNPKTGVDYSKLDNASQATTDSNQSTGNNNQGTSNSGGTSSTGGSSGTSTGSNNQGSTNGGSSSNEGSGTANSGSNNGGQPGYYNYKNGK